MQEACELRALGLLRKCADGASLARTKQAVYHDVVGAAHGRDPCFFVSVQKHGWAVALAIESSIDPPPNREDWPQSACWTFFQGTIVEQKAHPCGISPVIRALISAVVVSQLETMKLTANDEARVPEYGKARARL